MSPGERDNFGTWELASDSGWVIHEAVVSGACGESVGVGKVLLASSAVLVSREVTTPDTPGDRLVFGLSELASGSGLVAVESMLSDLLWEAFGVVLETLVPVPAEWTDEAVVSVSAGETVNV